MSQKSTPTFNADCRQCPRLATFLDQVADKHPDYHAAPVAAFGDPDARLLIVGLAPGMHGANATGRPFTGDYAGILLYQTLHNYRYGSLPVSVSRDDGLVLSGVRITNAVKCLPPQNKPQLDEVKNCNRFLRAEIGGLSDNAVVMALGKLAHDAVLRALGLKLSAYPFGHKQIHALSGTLTMVDSYHCSRYNTQTRRLTADMFAEVFDVAGELLGRVDG
ncbi:MAG TPA: uracil-DNA glycosylase [Gammaproteobacteria bacterium]|jgi:uracil-DNA glycosylase family 4|nr:uracil-DNA glycosylase [Gammaproteobacteria bacterium]